jgi:hypothetical protein
LAGTAKQYSKKAIPHPAKTSIQTGVAGKRSCPYQANVMKTLDTLNKTIGKIIGQFMESSF